jgi:hypothetical protein
LLAALRLGRLYEYDFLYPVAAFLELYLYLGAYLNKVPVHFVAFEVLDLHAPYVVVLPVQQDAECQYVLDVAGYGRGVFFGGSDLQFAIYY